VTRLPAPLRPWWPQAKAAYTRVTSIVAPMSRQVARLTDHGGPQGVALTAEQAVAASGPPAQLWVVREPECIDRPVPPGEPPRDYRFLAATSALVPRVAVATLANARVDGRFGGVIGGDQRLVYEFSQYFGISSAFEHPLFLRPFRRRPFEHPGTVAVLAGRGDDNYYHFLLDIVPKLALLADCPGLPPVDAYYVPTNRSFQRDLLGRFGITADRTIDSRETPHLRARTLVAVGLPDAHLQTPSWVVSWLRSELLPDAVDPAKRRRLYVSRGASRGSRIVVNEADVLAALAPLGFEVIDPGSMSVTAQIAAFAAAEVIVAPHGAALANLVFATAARVVEMFTPDYVNTCYWALSDRVPDIDYRYVVGEGPIPPGDPQGVASDIRVDVDRLLRVLDL
jgi:capsular polysaccharide biosynthesis protein